MLMLSEVHSAVQYGAKAVWVVLNDACYLMCEHGMSVLGWKPFGTRMHRVDFVGWARSLGAEGLAVTSEMEVENALYIAMTSERPFVLDAQMPRSTPTPPRRWGRCRRLQGKGGRKKTRKKG